MQVVLVQGSASSSSRIGILEVEEEWGEMEGMGWGRRDAACPASVIYHYFPDFVIKYKSLAAFCSVLTP